VARQPRIELPGIAQHIVQRGNNRHACFAGPGDYAGYLLELAEAALKHDCAIHAYVLMTNHVHLLATPSAPGSISRMMQMIGRRYVGCFNARYRRTGTLWEGRYKAALVGSARHALACYRYIELNPVRAHMVDSPVDYRWSSHAHNALGIHQPMITYHTAYMRLADTATLRCERYRALVAEKVPPEEIDEIRTYTKQQRVYGSDKFRQQIEALTNRVVTIRPRGRPKLEPAAGK
jgi:putative transposase